MTEPTSPRYTARQLGDGAFSWGPYDTDRDRWILSTRLTQADAQQRADQLNAAGVDWTYQDDPPRYGEPIKVTPEQKIRQALDMAERATDEAGRAVDAAADYVLTTGGPNSSGEYEAAVKFYDAAKALLDATKKAAQDLEAARPTDTKEK